ncbi:MAG: hypothetical protein JW839_15575 [Candidatus Lokiarchaeota archaeon]|nr:hypothetical protein [Candidatus Lokiarchaeota archaeon]
MERATLPRERSDTTRAQQAMSISSQRRAGHSLSAFLEGKEVDEAHAEYRSWSSFSPDPVLITCASAPRDARAEFFALSFQMIREGSGEVFYHFRARKRAHGWHTRDPWQLELRIYDKAGALADGLAQGSHDHITVGRIYCEDDGVGISSMNSVASSVWDTAHAVEVVFPSQTVHKC